MRVWRGLATLTLGGKSLFTPPGTMEATQTSLDKFFKTRKTARATHPLKGSIKVIYRPSFTLSRPMLAGGSVRLIFRLQV